MDAANRRSPEQAVEPGGPGLARSDVQGLRAVAVSAVLVFHLAPSVLAGGFVGVDVFFVISGYLITAHLARSAHARGRVRVLEFWARRARRLLPAAALVLAATWAASLAMLPASRLLAASEQVRASALYVQNWVLARNSVSYLTATDSPSPVQHFWSLSVEEQFYLAWPALFIGGWLLTRGRSWAGWAAQRRITAVLIVAVVGASLWYSAVDTHLNPQGAYFVTTTRVWELGLGGALALMPTVLSQWLARQRWLSVLGASMIGLSFIVITPSSAFPGTIALLPTIGAGLLLVAGWQSEGWGVARLLSQRPFVAVGDVSYALYLWHWPLIVLWEGYSGEAGLPAVDAIAIAACSIVLAALTKRYVEDPIRHTSLLVRHTGRSLAMVFTLLVPLGVVAISTPSLASSFTLDAAHPGGAVLASAGLPVAPAPVLPRVVAAPHDAAGFVSCEVVNADSRSVHCRLGDTTAPRLTVAVVGDSVIGQWQTALDEIAERNHWLLVTDYRASCDWSATMTAALNSTEAYTACHDWGINALHDLLTTIHPDVIITSGRPTFGTITDPTPNAASFAAIARGTAAYWRQLIAAGTKVVALAETPEMGRNIPDCLSAANGSVASCSVRRSIAVRADDPIERTVALIGHRAHLIDMNSLICAPRTCSPVVGNVLVYMDAHHLTETYTRTLQPYLERMLLATTAFAQ